ncbi:MAG: alternate-type signal peptide domain-containing protein [Paeniglutamicibacter sp.]
MNKMTKGALATGLGVALLLGGGGTLAVWNTTVEANAGKIVTGDLQLTAGQGTWSNASGQAIDPATYKVVPGDELRFSQPVTVKLTGDQMRASLTVSDKLGSTASYLSVANPVLTDGHGATVPAELVPASSGVYTASVLVTFPASTTGTTGAEATNDLGKIGFKLEQKAPTSPTP